MPQNKIQERFPRLFGTIKKRFPPINHAFDVPVNCKLNLGKLYARPATRATHAAVQRLLHDACWPSRSCKWTVSSISDFSPIYSMPDKRDFIGQYFSVKLGRSVRYESIEKRRFLKKLELAHSVVWYVENPFVVPYSDELCARIHVPDVLVWLRDKRMVVCRTEPAHLMKDELGSARWQALMAHCHQLGWGLLFTDGEHSHLELARRDGARGTCFTR